MAQSQRDALTFQFLGNTAVAVKDLKVGLVYNWKFPENIEINLGYQVEESTQRNALGQSTIADLYVTGLKPEATLNYSGYGFEQLCFSMGMQLESGTYDLAHPMQLQVKASTYPAKTSGKAGYGITVDAVTYGAKTDITGAKKSVPLTQQPFATFAPTTDDSFAIGAHSELKFSDNLVEDEAFVTLSVKRTVVGNKMGETLNPHEISGLVVGTDGRIMFLFIPQIIIDPSQGKFNATQKELSIPMRIIQPPDWCTPFLLVDSAELASCN